MKRSILFDPKQGYPAGRDVVYECTACGGLVRSMPSHDEPWECSCKNIRVDADAGRVSVRDAHKLKAFYDRPQHAILSRTEFESLLDEARARLASVAGGSSASSAVAAGVLSDLDALASEIHSGRGRAAGAPMLRFGSAAVAWPEDADPDLLELLSALMGYANLRLGSAA